MNVVQSGDVWHLSVCTTDSITASGSTAVPPAPESRQLGIQLTPVPQNTKIMMGVMRTMFRAIQAAAMKSMNMALNMIGQ
ncbi:hypothetical protein IWW38_003059 [Coemansia aciculifera]|uniref:Uncharacterized protein n=1 Tax=Coemansia aciculifera TaxID=417176 RepID=A0ACC1M1G6_9FUNG|nr:hypothetical protein IWW38_003059 [Coemansia aciculifera]